MLMLMVALIVDITLRNLGFSVQGIAEMSVFIMMIVIYLGFGQCEQKKAHVEIEFITEKLKGKTKTITRYLAYGLNIVAAFLLTKAVVLDALKSYKTKDSIQGIIDLPIWPTKFIMVIGIVVFFAQVLFSLKNKKDNKNTYGGGE